MKPRGLRNNNPLNIRKNGTAWLGLSSEQTDNSFFVFKAPEWGYRAAIIILNNYRKKHGLKTVSEWITRWAPPCENNTSSYISTVCRMSSMSPDDIVDVCNKQEMCLLVAAMSYVENGVCAVMNDVYKGWDMS